MTDKERYQSYKDRGICVYCKCKPSEDGKTTCRNCREKQRKQTAEKRAVLHKMGYCTECGSNKVFGSEKICPECAARKYINNRKNKNCASDNEYHKERRERLKAAGICVMCGRRKSETGKTRCATCNIKEANRARQRRGCLPRSERPNYGMCYFCGGKIEFGRVCEQCKERLIRNLPEERDNSNHPFREMEQIRIANIKK